MFFAYNTMPPPPAAAAQHEVVRSIATPSLSEREQFIEHQRELLENLRDDLLGRRRFPKTESVSGQHIADAAEAYTEASFALSLLAQDSNTLRDVTDALHRIACGSYGICELTGDEIPLERLMVRPFARYTVAAQVKEETEERVRYSLAYSLEG